MQITLQEAIQATQTTLIHDLSPQQRDLKLTGITMDSRNVKPGDLFVAICGETTDGHLYAADAVRAGAIAVLAQYDPFENEVKSDIIMTPVMLAKDSVKALGLLGRHYRDGFVGKVIGVTGSAGKTTLKETLAHILSLHGPTARNPLNYNTQIGLPLSMLNTTGDEAYWVMEAGISHLGDMDELGAIMAPDLAIVLNVGQAHTEGLGIRGVAASKASLLKYLQPKGHAIVSADYPDLVRETRKITMDAVYFSVTGKQLNFRSSYLGTNAEGKGIYRLWLDGTTLDVTSLMTGPYGAENIIAAATAAYLLGVDIDTIAHGIDTAPLPKQRFARKELPGWVLLDDSYNANPLSFAKMLEAVGSLSRDKTLAVVAGEMFELGDSAEQEHINLGHEIAETGTKAVFYYGNMADAVREGLKESHYNGLFQPISGPDDFMESFQTWNAQRKDNLDGMIFFKGSRGNKLERMVNIFTETMNGSGENNAL